MEQVREAREILRQLGARLRALRLERNDTMAVMAERLGVSERTVRALEEGRPTVQIGTWLHALWLFDELRPLEGLLQPRQSLLDRVRRKSERQRASRRAR